MAEGEEERESSQQGTPEAPVFLTLHSPVASSYVSACLHVASPVGPESLPLIQMLAVGVEIQNHFCLACSCIQPQICFQMKTLR